MKYLWEPQRRGMVGSFNFMISITTLKQDVGKEVSPFWGSGRLITQLERVGFRPPTKPPASRIYLRSHFSMLLP